LSAAAEEPLILVADDDEDMLELARLQLEEGGFRIATADDGEEALRVARERLPDLCVLDVVMPGLRGHEVLRELRDDEATAGIPVMLLTATLEQRALWRLGPKPDDAMHKQSIGSELEDRARALIEAREPAPAAAG
jgi:CheY-like chemotaxis protein